jgi:hypothetical protein
MCFDSFGNIFTTNFDNGSISKFNKNGQLVAASWTTTPMRDPESCVLDVAGNVYVGEAGGRVLRKFNQTGNLLATFFPQIERIGIDWIDLARDQCTMLYTSEGSSIKAFDTCSDVQLADVASNLPGECFALRIRLDGEIMVACRSEVLRLGPDGQVLTTYPASGLSSSFLFAMNLDPDGTSFWTADYDSGHVSHVRISDGALLGSFAATPDPGSSMSGLAVFGEFTSGTATDSFLASEANEPSMDVNPTDHNNVVVGYNKRKARGVYGCGFARSLDGGKTWDRGFLTPPSDFAPHGSDPSLTFTPDGIAYLSCLADGDIRDFSGKTARRSAVIVWSSGDKGLTFSSPVILAEGVHQGTKVGTEVDQEAISGDPFSNRVYGCWTEFVYGSSPRVAINFSRRIVTTGSWTPPIEVSASRSSASVGCSIAVTGTGRIWVSWWDVDASKAMAAYSDNRARTFSRPTVLGRKFAVPNSNGLYDLVGHHVTVRAEPILGSNRVVAVWGNASFSGAVTDLTYSLSTSWQPVRVVSPRGIGTRQPTLDWGADKTILLGFYSRTGSQVVFAVGQTLDPAGSFDFRAIASAPSNDSDPAKLGDLGNPKRLGDYQSVAEIDGKALATWSDDRSGPPQQVWFGAIG